MKVHFIAIGGSAMHNLAIALHLKGYKITGSDDEIFEPAYSHLAQYGLLPALTGWFPEKLDTTTDAVIVGMHARPDNPELLMAKKLNLKIYSYPEYLYEQSKDKIRIVVSGSHGKTTITAMIIHVLQKCGIDCDYMVGAQLAGFDVMVKLSDTASITVIEGDEYLTSPIDRRPKFHLYKPTIGIISGIAWDHVNVFPTFEIYVQQFKIFADMIPDTGRYIYCADDAILAEMSRTVKTANKFPYTVHPYCIRDGITWVKNDKETFALQIFGQHNLTNLNAARLACEAVGVNSDRFYQAITSFGGASNRLELVAKGAQCLVYKDFAHSPSKVKATVKAVREHFPDYHLMVCLELHTFSSLSVEFLPEYAGTMDLADEALVFYSPDAVAHKKLPKLSVEQIVNGFCCKNLEVFNDTKLLQNRLLQKNSQKKVLLLMSSGNFGGLNIEELSNKIVLLQS